jgi:hypothetical protein
MTFKYRCGLKKCMIVVDVNDYRMGMSVVVDYYTMQNVRIKGKKPLTNYVKYLLFCNGIVLDINGQ